MYCSLFIHYLLRLSWSFQVWGIMNKTAKAIHVRLLCVDLSFQLLWVNAEAWLMDWMLRLCLVFYETIRLSSKMSIPFALLINNESESLLLHIHASIWMFSVFWTLVILIFNLQFLNDIWCWTSFHIFMPSEYLLERCLFRYLPILKLSCSFYYSVLWFF